MSHPALAAQTWRRPEILLIILAAAMPLSFSTWMALLNNFAIEQADFTGKEMGFLQSIREIPGFLAFTAVWVLLLLREQTFALLSLLVLGIGVMLTGYFPTFWGLAITTLIMSTGFHYLETMQTALSLQWLSKEQAPKMMGWQMSAKSAASLVIFGLVWVLMEPLDQGYELVYVIGGGLTVAAVLFCWFAFPAFEQKHPQHKKMILRKRYWLYYALTFMSGARRQIFVVFAGFLMVEKFGYSAGEVAVLFLINHVVNMFLAPKIGGFITRFGERRALMVEYAGLILVFSAYAFVENPWGAAALYVIDHVFFAMAIAIKSYFQKIADPKDISSTAGISFTINHIAAVVIPAAFGLLWLVSPSAVFLAGAAMAVISFLLSLLVPETPEPGRETTRAMDAAPIVGAQS